MLPVLGLLALTGVAAFLVWERHDRAKAWIEADLIRARAVLVKLEADWMDMDRDSLTYDVVYDDSRGRRMHNRCKVAVRADSDDKVYWRSPLI